MNTYVKEFLKRGLMFSGFGPIVLGIVFLCLSLSIDNFSLTGGEVLIGILSTYLLAFVHAGVSIFNQIEGWSVAKSVFFHLSSLYLAYVSCYLVNSWIPFEPLVIAIFTVAFVALYFIIWLIVYVSVKSVSRKLCREIEAKQ